MSKVITGSINTANIEKERLYQGKKGKYLNITILMRDEVDEYGNNGMIVQSVSKEERERGVKGPILGNVKAFNNESKGTPSNQDDGKDGMPF